MEQMCENENSHRDAVASRRWYIMGRTGYRINDNTSVIGSDSGVRIHGMMSP